MAEIHGNVVGFAYVSPYRSRAAYRFTGEHSVYVLHKLHGKGIGRALVLALMKESQQAGLRQFIAAVGDSNNAASVAFHVKLRFKHVGTLLRVGYKFDRWLDVVLLQCTL